MHECLNLAAKGICYAAPNPMVGAVIVHNNHIIGQGYHECYGKAHAEPNAIRSVKDQDLLKESTLYVNLEPCAHHGKTPPCAALIIEKGIPRVVICNIDPFPKVAGKGIKMMQDAGIEVVCGVLEKEGRELNKRFFTFHEKKRPYIILKWAQSVDNFIDINRKDSSIPPYLFSIPETQMLNHRSRAEEAAILVGTRTILMDNPQLTNRLYEGKNPLRIGLDRDGQVTTEFRLLDNSAETIIFTEKERENTSGISFKKIDFSKDIISEILSELYKREKLSLIIEGGSKLLQSFIDKGVWDEARVEIAPVELKSGVNAPSLNKDFIVEEKKIESNLLLLYRNKDN